MDPAIEARLLSIARAAVRAVVDPNVRTAAIDLGDVELPAQGAFVTLRRDGRLRGCIGTFSPRGPLAQVVAEMAAAAARDPRFVDDPISPNELSRLTIELSVLSPLERAENPLDMRIGEHGIYIRGRRGTGCFLPQVAVEYHWTAEEFLTACCVEKAHLPPDAWRQPETEVYLFSVEKFEETPA